MPACFAAFPRLATSLIAGNPYSHPSRLAASLVSVSQVRLSWVELSGRSCCFRAVTCALSVGVSPAAARQFLSALGKVTGKWVQVGLGSVYANRFFTPHAHQCGQRGYLHQETDNELRNHKGGEGGLSGKRWLGGRTPPSRHSALQGLGRNREWPIHTRWRPRTTQVRGPSQRPPSAPPPHWVQLPPMTLHHTQPRCSSACRCARETPLTYGTQPDRGPGQIGGNTGNLRHPT